MAGGDIKNGVTVNTRATSIMSGRRLITDLQFSELAALLDARGEPRYRAEQIFDWVYRKRAGSFDEMTNLPVELRHTLAAEFLVRGGKVVRCAESRDTLTSKFLIRLHDNETIETVLMRDKARWTLCVSTQVGCPLGCLFCATGRAGFVRNLTAGEIVEQVLAATDAADMAGHSPNLVYMGMGEPFLNYDATVKSIRILMEKEGMGIGARNITVSTVGIVPGIERFAREGWQVRLSVSLHSVDDNVRRRLMPAGKRYPVAAVLNAVRAYASTTERHPTFEYVLIDGVNDARDDARRLAETVRGIPCSVNLIVFNRVEDAHYRPAPIGRANAFRETLQRAGIRATLRRPRGGDIDAACGQLRHRR
jgi:23S rRNA (adenine2503-C2)-methyltransferase